MKRLSVILLLAIAITSFCSCKKSYTCSYYSWGDYYEIEMKTHNRKNAEVLCLYQCNGSFDDGPYNCELK
ncbi:MAG: hypothetical protein H6551_07630 [Chitinophagales bacterium]|nr:hypothetical protein [Chitinophagaceae bacterium]MCB9065000.1 hypothetical protein [Chitinophagales bacterium]